MHENKPPFISDEEVDRLLREPAVRPSAGFEEQVMTAVREAEQRRSRTRSIFVRATAIAAVLVLGALPIAFDYSTSPEQTAQTVADRPTLQVELIHDPVMAEMLVLEERYADAMVLIQDGMLLADADF